MVTVFIREKRFNNITANRSHTPVSNFSHLAVLRPARIFLLIVYVDMYMAGMEAESAGIGTPGTGVTDGC